MTSLINALTMKIVEIFSTENLPKKIAVAVSGGVDSLALTVLLDEFCREKKIKLLAVTVDHKMRQSSTNEALELGKILKKKKISHQILEVDLEKLPQSNIEAKLREVRYELLYDFCLENKIEFLFLGHQMEDVAENFLIRLFRGSGLDGLSAISEMVEFKKIKLVRPLLNFEKDDLRKFLTSKKIKWFEDESNTDEKFLRNKIRNFFNSFEEKSLIQKRIKSASDEIATMRDFVDEAMLREAKEMLEFKSCNPKKTQIKTLKQVQGRQDLSHAGCFLLNQKNLQTTTKKIALKILALTLMEVSGNIYKPRLEQLKNFYEHLTQTTPIKPRNFYGCMVRKYDKERLIIYREKKSENLKNIQKFDKKNFLIDGRFLTENPEDFATFKFHFRTILKEIF